MEWHHEYTAHDGNYTPGGNSCEYIVVHYTGNNASANAEARYAESDQHPSSYHYVLDDDACYQLLNDSDTAWAVGAWPGATQLISNRRSISIEVCSNGEAFTAAEQANLREVVGMLMERHGIDADHVVRHWDCHTGRKDCPWAYAGSDNAAWTELHAYITGGSTQATSGWLQSETGGQWWWCWDDGTYPANEWQQIDDVWYHFDSDGWMQTGWLEDDGKWYYLNPQADGTLGAMQTGWIEINNVWYYLDGNGVMQTGWLEPGDGYAYWLDWRGHMATGWQRPEGAWAYFDESGHLARSGCYEIDGKWYVFDGGGALVDKPACDEDGALVI